MKLYDHKPVVMNEVEIGLIRREQGGYYCKLFTDYNAWHGPFKTEQAATDWIVSQLKVLRDKLNQAFGETI